MFRKNDIPERASPTTAALLRLGIHPRLLRADAVLIARVEADFAASGGGGPDALATFLGDWIGDRLARIETLHREYEAFGARFAAAVEEEERRAHILDFARALGADSRRIRGDQRAFRRYFGRDAVVERYRRRVGEAEQAAAFGLERLGHVAAHLLGELGQVAELWQQIGIEATVERASSWGGDYRVRVAGFRCLARALRAVPANAQEGLIGEATLRRVYRSALHRRGVWTPLEALDLLSTLSPVAFARSLERRLAEPGEGDDLFVRRRVAALLCINVGAMPALARLFETVRRDSSPAVRQGLAFNLCRAPASCAAPHLTALLRNDPAPEVRAAVLTTLPELLVSHPPAWLAELWRDCMAREASDFVLRTALKTADDGLAWLVERDEVAARHWYDALVPEIERLHVEAPQLPVRRWAAQARERLWCRIDPEARTIIEVIAKATEGLDEGRTRMLRPLAGAIGRDPDLVGRVMAVLAQSDFGYDLETGPTPRLRRGELFGFRSWRALYEYRHPAPDKRQAFRHTSGRVFRGTVSAPSSIMAELAPTKVPGEPLFLSEEGGWRPYLPLPDHALSAIDTGQTVRLFTPEGLTEVEPPVGLFQRLRARFELSWRFADFAAMRNWSESRNQPPATYVSALRELGFDIRLRPLETVGAAPTKLDSAVTRFFSVGPVGLLAVPEFLDRLGNYFVSVYENSLGHLGMFISVALVWFFGRHVWLNRVMRQTRNELALVLGGWGTRGKSGTERLKAAMLNALGYPLVSKTTGCEAMFLYGNAFGDMREMFLFRPYDKATIWEQFDLARLSVKLGAKAFLWECMGLTPSYVKVLQRHWMRDDISTITNTYPDHEDVQGPAGRNIPEVMTNFIPESGTLLTTEEQMRPILGDAARALGTRMVGVDWLDAGLLASDILKRFPYEEHPSNIALVLALADEIGVDRDFAVKEMADRVVLDLGVLKTYPVAPVRGRRLEFVMGMSANERFGALGNWKRMGFDTHDPFAEPGIWFSTVVNNRADRVPRSHVFAAMLANDVSADTHILIGSNLEGLQGYIEDAWRDHAQTLTLWPNSGAAADPDPLETLRAAARWHRIPHEPAHVEVRLRAMLVGLGHEAETDQLAALSYDPEALAAALASAGVPQADAIAARVAEDRQSVEEYQNFARDIPGGDSATLDQRFRDLLRAWFCRKIVPVENYYATGDQIVDLVAATTPPGFRTRIMGMQNIKGTGLDFVYRWQAWEACHKACADALSGDPSRAAAGVRALAAFQEFGVLSEEYVRETVERLKVDPPVAGESFRSQLDLVRANLDQQVAAARETMTASRGGGRFAHLSSTLENFLDPGDAIRRRRKADRIYRDMIDERISHDRAALELKKLTARQKGGWLEGDVSRARLAVKSLTPRRRPQEPAH